MRIGIFLNYAGGFAETVVKLADYERAGADIVFVPEAYSFDAVSQLGFIAAKTERMQIASGILPLDAIHSMYWETCGDPHGIPVVFLHGWPGSGWSSTCSLPWSAWS